MADDVMNQNGTAFDAQQQWGRLSERVENQGRDIVDLRSNMNTGFRNMESAINALSSELRGSSKTQWPVIWSAIGVSFAILIAVGSQSIAPLRSDITDLKASNAAAAEKMVTREELDWRASRGTEDRERNNLAIADLREASVTRNEWSERNRARDQEITDLSRRIEEIRAILGSQYTTRDVLLELQAEVKDLRSRRASRMP